MLQLQTLGCSRNKKELWLSLTSSDMEVQTLGNSLMYAADSNTFLFHAYTSWTHRAASWLVSNNSSWRRGTGFHYCNKALVEIFCKGMAFRNKRLNCILFVLEAQVKYVWHCVWQSSWWEGGLCSHSLYSAQQIYVLLEASYWWWIFWWWILWWWIFWVWKSARRWIEGSIHLFPRRLWKDC